MLRSSYASPALGSREYRNDVQLLASVERYQIFILWRIGMFAETVDDILSL
jgi:hypothetical protein